MTTLKANLIPLTITPGVQPSTDMTALATPHYTQADKIRFRFGFPQKIGGWYAVPFNYNNTIMGKARSLYSSLLTTTVNTLIGTHLKVYSVIGSQLTNITPFDPATTTTIANSIATNINTLDTNPIATINGSAILTVNDSFANLLPVGTAVTLSGLTSFNGLSSGVLNSAHIIHTIVDSTHYTIIVATAANATGSGGGALGKAANGVVTFHVTAHGLSVGDRVKIALAADTGGILAANINGEHLVVYAGTPDLFGLLASNDSTPTSSVSSGGGSSTTYTKEIAAGNADESQGQGYGMGLFGVGLYGTAHQSAALLTYPRIWFFDRFGVKVIMTAGNQTGLYSWDGATSAAPVPITNAPTMINYAFVSDDIVVTFGAGGTPNRILSCDQANLTQWTASSSNQVFDYTVSGASRLISHAPVAGVNLLFTDHQTYLFQYTGFIAGAANAIWNIKLLEPNVGIIGAMARCAVGGTAYWMDVNNFYMWSGGDVTVIPSNSQPQSTIHNYVFGNMNTGQSAKFFAWYNEQFNEVWFHYCSAGSNDPDRVARYNVIERHWTPDTFDRLCGEYPNLTLGYPRLVDSHGVMYAHEQGTDANGSPMAWSLGSNVRGGSNAQQRMTGIPSKETCLISGFVPDSVQTGDISVEIIAKRYPQSPQAMYDETYTVSPDTEFVPVQSGGRLWQYKLSGSALGQKWIGGQWMEYVQTGSPQ